MYIPVLILTLCTENDFYPEFIDRDVTVVVSASLRRGDVVLASLRRGDVVAQLEARDDDLASTCHGGHADDCPCARLNYAIEAGDTARQTDRQTDTRPMIYAYRLKYTVNVTIPVDERGGIDGRHSGTDGQTNAWV